MSFSPMTFPQLETERTILRGLEAADLDGFEEIYADEAHARFVGGAKSRFDCWEKLTALLGHWQLRGFGRFAVEEKATGKFVGHCGPSQTGFVPEPEINYSFTPYAQGKGFAFEATQRVLRYVYDALGWASAVSLIDEDNIRSIKLAERLGAVKESDINPYGDYYAQVWRHLPPEEFRERYA